MSWRSRHRARERTGHGCRVRTGPRAAPRPFYPCRSPWQPNYRYDPAEIEPRWQRVWADEGTWEVANDATTRRPKSYVLEMLPYPSGEPHIGHLKVYSRRRRGRALPPPQRPPRAATRWATTRSGCPPRTTRSRPASTRATRRTRRSPSSRSSFASGASRSTGRASSARTSRASTAGRSGSSSSSSSAASPTRRRRRSTGTRSRRPCSPTSRSRTAAASGRGALVEVRQLTQWFFRITDYADRLLEDLATIEWPEHVKIMQRNWIGRSEGAEVTFRCEEAGTDYVVFTTRPGHALRRDVLRDGARAPRRAAPRRGHRARGRRCASTSTAR